MGPHLLAHRESRRAKGLAPNEDPGERHRSGISVLAPTVNEEPASLPAESEIEAIQARRVLSIKVLTGLRTYGIVIAFVVLVVTSRLLYAGFLDWRNIKIILEQNAVVGLVALGLTFVILAGGFDLSVGSVVGIGSVVAARLSGHNIVIVFIGAVVAGVVTGLLNGIVVCKLRVNPFIATLGTGSLLLGAVTIYTHSSPVISNSTSFQTMGTREVGGVTVADWIVLAAFVVGGIVLAYTTYGLRIYAIGGNKEASRLAGMRVNSVQISAYVVCGACAAVAGVFLAAQSGSGQSDIGGSYTLTAFSIVVIGGTSLFGGEGAVWRTLVGLLIIGCLGNLFDSLALQTSYQNIAQGAILIAFTMLDAMARSART